MNVPTSYAQTIGTLPKDATITKDITRSHSFIHLFARNKAELERDIDGAVKALAPKGLLWISFPKGVKTDLTRDKGWECWEKLAMQWLTLINFDKDWSAFLMKNAPPRTPSKTTTDYQTAQGQWVDPSAKAVRISDDLFAAFQKNAEARLRYEALAYTNKKVYVLWVVGRSARKRGRPG